MSEQSIRSEKSALREELKRIRDALALAAREEAGAKAAERLFSSPIVEGKRNIMLYSSIRSEVPTRHFAELARERGMRVALPRVMAKEGRLDAVWIDRLEQLERRTMGILEPRAELPAVDPLELELIIVPGLGFDREGYRIGYGAGYYDKFLPTAGRAVRVGLTYEACLVERIPREEHDQPVHFVLTESRLLSTRSELRGDER